MYRIPSPGTRRGGYFLGVTCAIDMVADLLIASRYPQVFTATFWPMAATLYGTAAGAMCLTYILFLALGALPGQVHLEPAKPAKEWFRKFLCRHNWEPCIDVSAGREIHGEGCRKCDSFRPGPQPGSLPMERTSGSAWTKETIMSTYSVWMTDQTGRDRMMPGYESVSKGTADKEVDRLCQSYGAQTAWAKANP